MPLSFVPVPHKSCPAPQSFLGYLITGEFAQEGCRDGEEREGRSLDAASFSFFRFGLELVFLVPMLMWLRWRGMSGFYPLGVDGGFRELTPAVTAVLWLCWELREEAVWATPPRNGARS